MSGLNGKTRSWSTVAIAVVCSGALKDLDLEKPKSVTGKAQTPHKRHLGPVSVITSESTILTTRYP
jgi:hypothetical protein